MPFQRWRYYNGGIKYGDTTYLNLFNWIFILNKTDKDEDDGNHKQDMHKPTDGVDTNDAKNPEN